MTKFKNLLLLNFWASFILYMTLTSLKCLHRFELVSQVSDVAHGPRVPFCTKGRTGFYSVSFFREQSCRQVTPNTVYVGTLHYIAPEMADGRGVYDEKVRTNLLY